MPRTKLDPVFQVEHLQVLDKDGKLDERLEPDIPEEDLLKLHRTMVLARTLDERMLRLQRQGRIGTFAPVIGQEAAQLGSIYALRMEDWFVPAFREVAATLWRGADPFHLITYSGGYEEGIEIPEDARDMPIAIPVASQCCHAVGIAMAEKLKGTGNVAIVYFGDGATSHGDFHEAANFAGVLKAPLVLLCQNNHWAISVPLAKQTASETLAQKAFAYGMPCIQVDGNDLLAVYVATKEAVERARVGKGPTLIEAVTYRMSVHTTADDPTKYRSEEEVDEWRRRDPLERFEKYLRRKGVLDDEAVEEARQRARERVGQAVERYESELDPDPRDMFDHAYAEPTGELERQRKEFEEYLDWLDAEARGKDWKEITEAVVQGD